jgi:hypothetical protein
MVKATLRLVLQANDVVVAESIDPALWSQTLASITGGDIQAPQQAPAPAPAPAPGAAPALAVAPAPETPDVVASLPRMAEPSAATAGVDWPSVALEAFATELQLPPAVVKAACDPITTPPYLHLDVHAWETFKRNTGARGSHAVPQIVLSSALLLLWFRQSGQLTVTVDQAQAVLKTIGLRDKNVGRGLKNCNWLQVRDDTIRLNPTKFSTALALARAYCSHQPLAEREGAEKS